MHLRYKGSQATFTCRTGWPWTQTLFSSESGRSKLSSKTAGTIVEIKIQLSIYQMKVLSGFVERSPLANWSLRTLLMRKLLTIFQLKEKWKTAGRLLLDDTQWRSQNTADVRAQRGHTTFASSLIPRPRPAFSRLQYGMHKQLGGVWGMLPIKSWNF